MLRLRALQRHRYGPLCVGGLASTIILVGRFQLDAAQATSSGVGVSIPRFNLEQLNAAHGCPSSILRALPNDQTALKQLKGVNECNVSVRATHVLIPAV
jgi:hypothetical protein